MRQLVLVVGSGRSGTSLLAGVLRELGYKVPKPEVAADPTNPRGFAEPKWLVDFHNRLLREARVHATDARPEAWGLTANRCLDQDVMDEAHSWLKDKYGDTDHVVLKDPRLLWFTTLWESIARDLKADPVFVTMLRPPTEVIKSKHTWYSQNLSPTNRAAGWLNTMLYTERAIRGKQRAYLQFESLVADWTLAVSDLDDAVGIPLLHTARAAQLASADQLVDSGLVRSQASWDQLGVSPAVSDLADRVWKSLQPLTTEPNGEATSSDLDALRSEYRMLYDTAEQIAQSSIIAAQPASGSPGAPARNHPGPPSLAVRIAKKVPASWRHKVPESTRRKLNDMLG